ncbi:pyridoxal phosphate-dependent aminotransferase [Rhizobium leguminosarum]|uniref:pyridoxal phosphate-dependent aminotransferase n=1 Tax=Rhizobium leguminosarum TaxID=384 RepID=UPI001C97783F|nr:pyridoxal phosphate-dependent aminotransferase [Rhizobium leguminosarum]MBY5637842.1 pyridoxal phosphate-dependent aminotransferase [Rhizobium leguminosarum]
MKALRDLSLGTLDPFYCQAEEGSNNAYAPRQGLPALVQLLGARFAVDASEVLVTAGASMGLTCAFLTCPPARPILLPSPGFPAYEATLRLLGRSVITYKLDHNWDANVLRMIEQEIPAAVLLNSPGNPLGNVITDQQRQTVCDVAQACCVTLILDETYAGLEFSGSASTGPLLGEATGVIRIGSFSKRFAQPGLRIGYVIAGPKTCRQMTDINWVLAMSPCVSSQLAAADLLMAEVKNPGRIKNTAGQLEASADLAMATLATHGIAALRPNGGPLLWIEFPGAQSTGAQLAAHCMEHASVIASPGEAFRRQGPPAIRCSYAIARYDIPAVFDRLGAALARWKSENSN